MKTRYRGRFAPSPTGSLHFGSLVAAVGSFLQARSHGGEWLVRIEDLDPPREVAGAADDILRTLESLGLTWDGEVVYQSRRGDIYRHALDELRRADAIYACACSRKEIADSSLLGSEGPIYPGTCRTGVPEGRTERALRVRTDGAHIVFDDRWQGRQEFVLQRDFGDFIVRRVEGLPSYQLAVVVDDAAQGISEVVRGADLLLSTPRQIHLQSLLGLPTPAYAHLPALVNAQGEKLSKQTGAPSISTQAALPLLRRALAVLGQHAPAELEQGEITSLWRYAISHWKPERVPRVTARTE